MTAAMTRDARRLCERRQILRGRSRAPRLRDRGLDAWRHGLCARISCRAVFPRDPDRAYRADQRAADPVAHRRTRVGAAEIVLTPKTLPLRQSPNLFRSLRRISTSNPSIKPSIGV